MAKKRIARFFLWSSALILLLAGAALLFLYWTAKPPADHTAVPLAELTPVIREGDLIFRKGYGFWSHFFRRFASEDEPFSHCGILSCENGQWVVIHADASDVTGIGQVRRESLESFLFHAEYWTIFRFRGTPEESAQIAAAAKEYIGRPFDSAFDLSDHSKIYCTELLMLSILSVRPDFSFALQTKSGRRYLSTRSCRDPALMQELCSGKEEKLSFP